MSWLNWKIGIKKRIYWETSDWQRKQRAFFIRIPRLSRREERTLSSTLSSMLPKLGRNFQWPMRLSPRSSKLEKTRLKTRGVWPPWVGREVLARKAHKLFKIHQLWRGHFTTNFIDQILKLLQLKNWHSIFSSNLLVWRPNKSKEERVTIEWLTETWLPKNTRMSERFRLKTWEDELLSRTYKERISKCLVKWDNKKERIVI